MKPRDAATALGVFAVALAYLLLLRPYGFQLEDEGTQLFWFDRVMRGQQPYLDFHTGYTPGFFAFGKAVFSVFGPSATALRGVLAVMNALTAAGLVEVTRRVAGRWLAPLPALLWLAFVPVYAGEFAAFNVPYPTWPVTLAWTTLALAMLSWIERPRAGLLVLSGVVAAFAMWFRPNSGAFALAAAAWVVVGVASRRSAVDRMAAVAGSAFMALGVWYTFEFRVVGADAFVHLLPTFAVALLCAGPLAKRMTNDAVLLAAAAPAAAGAPPAGAAPSAAAAPRATASLAVLAVAFLLPTLAWTLPLLRTLGLDRFLYEVFLVGADYQTLYYKPHPSPEPYALLVVAAMMAIAVGGRLVAQRRVPPLLLLIAVGVVGAIVKLAWIRESLAPEGLSASILAQFENASFWLAIVANFGAVAWLARVPAAELQRSPRARAMLVATPLAIAMYLQMFPRSDFMHQVTALPLTIVIACGLLARVASWWARGEWPARWEGPRVVRGGVQLAAASVLLLAFAGKVGGPLEAWSNRAAATPMKSRLDVHVEDAAGDEMAAIASTVEFLRAHTIDGEALWSFPATSGLLFAAGRTSIAPHDYWYPGRPDHVEEARVLGLLRDARPRFVVTLGRGWNFFAGSPGYFENIRGYVAGEYRLAARFGRYDVLGRRDVIDGEASPGGGPPPADDTGRPPSPGGRPASSAGAVFPVESVLDGNLERRRQAAARWMDSVTPEDVANAKLPEQPRDQLLLLRALRDGGDLRGAAWTILGYESPNARVRAEAAEAMLALTRDLRARQARFANDFDAAAWRPFVVSWTDRARAAGAANDALRPFADAVGEFSGSGSVSGSAGATAPPL